MTPALASHHGTTAPGAASPPITALVYDDGAAFERSLGSAIALWKAEGRRLTGIFQINVDRPGRRRCDMIVEELASGDRVLISRDRGDMARGCRLDHGALAAVVNAVEASLSRDVDILIVNKFGKEEVEGRGFRHAIALALENGTPVLVGVPARNAEAWRAFCGDDLATTLAIDEAIHDLPLATPSRRQPFGDSTTERPPHAETRRALA